MSTGILGGTLNPSPYLLTTPLMASSLVTYASIRYFAKLVWFTSSKSTFATIRCWKLYFTLKALYALHENKKCSSSSIRPLWHMVQILSCLGLFLCLPFSISRAWSELLFLIIEEAIFSYKKQSQRYFILRQAAMAEWLRAFDSKSNGIFPRRFESYSQRVCFVGTRRSYFFL